MEFAHKSSDVATVSGGLAKFSLDGQFIAVANGTRIVVYRNTNSSVLEKLQIFQCLDKAEHFEFSPDGKLILCALYSRTCVQVFSIADPNWKCRINEGPAGMISAFWAPDSQSILTESDFGIQLSFWSLVDNSQSILSLPKPSTKLHMNIAQHNNSSHFHSIHTSSSTTAFSSNGKYLAVVHRIDFQDYIAIYAFTSAVLNLPPPATGTTAPSRPSAGAKTTTGASSQQQQQNPPLMEITKFKAKSSQDIAVIQWLPYDSHLITIDVPLYYRVNIYSPMGELLTSYEAYQHALGIRTLGIFHPPSIPAVSATGPAAVPSPTTSSLIALGSFDGKIRFLSMFSTWQVALTVSCTSHPRELDVGMLVDGFMTKMEMTKLEMQEMITQRSQQLFLESMNNKNTNDENLVNKHHQRNNNNNTSSKDNDNKTPQQQQQSAYLAKMVKVLPKNPTTAITAMKSSITSANNAGDVPTVGIHWMKWSTSSKYLAASEEQYSRCLWIWYPLQAKLMELLIQQEPVTYATWRPMVQPREDEDGEEGQEEQVKSDNSEDNKEVEGEDMLAFCCLSHYLYLWTKKSGVQRIEPVATAEASRFRIHSLEWHPDGRSILLRGKEAFAIYHL